VSAYRPPIQQRLLPRGPGVYSEIEAAYQGLPRDEFSTWVEASYPWILVTGPEVLEAARQSQWPAQAIFGYMHMNRAPDDPERATREAARAKGEGYGFGHAQAKKLDRDQVRRRILHVTKDGRPRTYNRIAMEAFNITADMAPDNVANGLAELVLEGRLAVAPEEWSPAGEFVVLFWNDHHWQKLFGPRPTGAVRL